MKIAIAGLGSVARYLIEVVSESKHDVVALTRREKELPSGPKIEQRITDYTTDSLLSCLEDCDAVVSTLSGPDDFFVSAHLALLQACTRSSKCKLFFPSEFSVNIRDFADAPPSIAASRTAVRDALRAQCDVKWSLICSGWFMDYLIPSSQRYLPDLGIGFPVNTIDKTFELYGDGRQQVSLTSARDVARVLLALIESSSEQLPDFSFISAQALSYLELSQMIKEHDSTYTIRDVTFSQALQSILDSKTADERLLADLRIIGFTRAVALPAKETLQWGSGLLAGIVGRDITSFLSESSRHPDRII